MRTFRGEILSIISGAFCSEEIPPEYFPESTVSQAIASMFIILTSLRAEVSK